MRPRAQRDSSTFSSRLSERRERSERSEFRDGAHGRAPQGSRRVQRTTAPVKRRQRPPHAFAASPENTRRTACREARQREEVGDRKSTTKMGRNRVLLLTQSSAQSRPRNARFYGRFGGCNSEYRAAAFSLTKSLTKPPKAAPAPGLHRFVGRQRCTVRAAEKATRQPSLRRAWRPVSPARPRRAARTRSGVHRRTRCRRP